MKDIFLMYIVLRPEINEFSISFLSNNDKWKLFEIKKVKNYFFKCNKL